MNEDRSTRYHRRRRRVTLLAIMTRVTLLLGVLGAGWSPLLRDRAAEIARTLGVPDALRASTEVALYALVLALVAEAVALPLVWYAECVLDRHYGLSRRRAWTWVRGHVTTTVLYLVVCTAVAVIVYAAIRVWPGSWWAMAGVAFACSTIVVTHLAPILVLPRLYRVRPLARRRLRARLEALTQRVGAPVRGILEWQLGRDTPRPNATLVGMGPTRHVLLTDALLADYSDDEIEVALAHELGHHAHRDVWKTVAYEAAAATLALGVAHWVLGWAGPSVGVEGRSDVAGLPLLVLAGGAVVTALAPVANSMSRRHERRADQYALEITGNKSALMSGLRRLAAQHLAEERPSRLVEWLFCSHPPLADRLAAVRSAHPPVRARSSRPRSQSAA